MTIRTRFAPSPTGRLHLGNVRTAVFNWLFARRHGGAFILRIEDTDPGRTVEGAEVGILEDLRWLGLEWDEGPEVGGPYGPYRQSERAPLHRAHAHQLHTTGAAYPCFCGEEAGGEDRRYPGLCRALAPETAQRRVEAGERHVLRLRTPKEGAIEVLDAVRGPIAFPAEDLDDFVILRSDGGPTYNFSVVVDDMTMRISHVIRGAGHLSNTPKQLLLYRAFEAAPPVFAHLPTVLAPEGGKLSKRSGAAAVADLRAEGMLPQAVVNYLSLLGWSHPEEEEILELEELAASVELERVGASDTRFDPEKLRWVARRHLDRLEDEAWFAGVRGALLEAGVQEAGVRWAAEALRSRLATFGEVREHLHHLLPDPARLREARTPVVASEGGRILVRAVAARLRAVEPWGPGAIREAFREAGREVGVRGRDLFGPIRVVLTGEDHGPDLALLSAAAGREVILTRLKEALGSE